MSDLPQVQTPVGVVDLDRVRDNARRIVHYTEEHDLRWRPHIKTHKSREIARIQLSSGASGLTVATLREAEVMAGLCTDLLLAYPPVGEAKLERLMELPEDVDLTVGLDSAEALAELAAAARSSGRTVGVLVEQDVGLRRVGVPTADDVVGLAKTAAGLDGVTFRGLMFYPGHLRDPASEMDDGIEALGSTVATTLDALAYADLEPDIVSGGSTPTLWRSHEIPGLTEIRAGSGIFNDRESLELGVVEAERLAYTVLTTVVSTAVPGRAVVDAGSKALAKESRASGEGFGFVLDRPDVHVVALSEEHGVLDLEHTSWRPAIGDRVRIVPNHVCVSVNLQDRLLVADDGDDPEWIELEARGRGRWS